LVALPFLDIVRVRDFGSVLAVLTTGTSAIQAAAGVLGIVISTVVAWTLSRLSDARYRWQFLLVHLAIASGWLLPLERVVLGYHVDYFSVHFDRMYWPAFSVPSFLLASIFALLVPYALIRFFRRDTAPAGSSQSAGRLLDPSYQARAPLRVLIVLTAFAISLRAALAAASISPTAATLAS